ncbi:uncharacterized protein BDZ83DRAFT_425853 [Colletotrichum acutatum]|uniref:Uncharacterized protein n=1 Tax=Glomerella acutata TaxID=27357 RepID=A0AAD9D109_GLOAC|nr:uncharacterized protein BDZ83DRAFT_425853 [Colletotrichum acutatum]KAK1730162.1 hypothetical protein BDZ83DRAFT_425853 [Colletotrichum acutatum]
MSKFWFFVAGSAKVPHQYSLQTSLDFLLLLSSTPLNRRFTVVNSSVAGEKGFQREREDADEKDEEEESFEEVVVVESRELARLWPCGLSSGVDGECRRRVVVPKGSYSQSQQGEQQSVVVVVFNVGVDGCVAGAPGAVEYGQAMSSSAFASVVSVSSVVSVAVQPGVETPRRRRPRCRRWRRGRRGDDGSPSALSNRPVRAGVGVTSSLRVITDVERVIQSG